MDRVRKIAAGFLIFTGIVWFLQGINIIPGSFMTGDLRWAAAGMVSLAVGWLLWRRRNS